MSTHGNPMRPNSRSACVVLPHSGGPSRRTIIVSSCASMRPKTVGPLGLPKKLKPRKCRHVNSMAGGRFRRLLLEF